MQQHLNTSHVILYRNNHEILVSMQLFKYISCYSLSKMVQVDGETIKAFKYISCYSLSVPEEWLGEEFIKFKYISCYSLSFSRAYGILFQVYLNTSHVILYRLRLKSYPRQGFI